MLGMLGYKRGMTQVFDKDGNFVPVTVVEVGPCTVVQKNTAEKNGYNSVQLGIGVMKASRATKPYRGHFEKNSLPVFSHLKEFRTDSVTAFEVGDRLYATAFEAGDVINVSGVTKGRGFQGVIKRHGKHGGPASHGSDFHRRPGSIGMRTWPGRVIKNMKLPGHMGVERITVKNLEVVSVFPDDNVVLVRGAVPGYNGALLEIVPAKNPIESRDGLKGAKPTAAESVSEEAVATAKVEGDEQAK